MTQAPRMADDVVSPEGVPPDDDAALIAESCRVPDRFGAVFDRHAIAIHGYIARRLGPDAADDLVAEAFLVAFRKRADYDLRQPSARPWLYGIATRLRPVAAASCQRRRDRGPRGHALDCAARRRGRQLRDQGVGG
jgi:DNA-directed RNA polymerase specialized sigma24 family protein